MTSSLLNIATAGALLLGLTGCTPTPENQITINDRTLVSREGVEAVLNRIAELNGAGVPYIRLQINSPGGLLMESVEIANTVKNNPVPIHTETTKGCQGSAMLIFAAGAAGHRSCTAESYFSFPIDPTMSPKILALLTSQFQEICGPTLGAELMKVAQSNTMLDAEEAKKLGLVDTIR